jgi:nitrate reductase beta subunit
VIDLTAGTEHFASVNAVTDAVAVAVAETAGLLVTFAVSAAEVHFTVVVPIVKVAFVLGAKPDFSTAPLLTAVPPVLPIVSTWAVAASAETIGAAMSKAEAAAATM